MNVSIKNNSHVYWYEKKIYLIKMNFNINHKAQLLSISFIRFNRGWWRTLRAVSMLPPGHFFCFLIRSRFVLQKIMKKNSFPFFCVHSSPTHGFYKQLSRMKLFSQNLFLLLLPFQAFSAMLCSGRFFTFLSHFRRFFWLD